MVLRRAPLSARRTRRAFVAGCALALLGAAACGADPPGALLLPAGAGLARVTLHPFGLTLLDAAGAPLHPEGEAARVWLGVRDAQVPEGLYLDPEAPPAEVRWSTLGRLLEDEATPFGRRLTYASAVGEATAAAAIEVTVTLRVTGELLELDVAAPGAPLWHTLVELRLPLAADERVLGLGELFDHPESRGRVRPMQLRATSALESGTNEVHGPVSFYVSSRGYALYAESERPGAFDVGASDPARLRVRYQAQRLIAGLTVKPPLAAVAAYARHVGLPRPLPDWALGLQQWRNALSVGPEGTPSGQDLLLHDARRLRELGAPASVLWLDAPWETGYNTFAYNPVQFPDPPAMLAELEAQGFRVIVWATNYLNVSNDADQMLGMPPFASVPLYDAFAANGWLATVSDGLPALIPWARGRGALVDFTQGAARAAYAELARPLVEGGIRGFKLDYGEEVRPELGGLVNGLFELRGGVPIELHNRYQRLYHQTFRALLDETYGPNDGFILARSASHGDQSIGAVIWPGDLDSDFARHGEPRPSGKGAVGGLPAAVSAAISLGASAFPYFASDTGGFRGFPTSEALARWLGAAALAPVFQLGGGGQSHNPWDAGLFPEPWVLETFLVHARLHAELFPFLRDLVDRAAADGQPIVRALGLAFPDDPVAWTVGDAYLLGDALLVAPVIEQGAAGRAVYLPAGSGPWADFWTGARAPLGGVWLDVAAPVELAAGNLPLFQAAGTILPLASADVQTFAPATAPGLVDWPSRRHLLRARVVLDAADTAALALHDGTTLGVSPAGGGLALSAVGLGERRLAWELDRVASDRAPISTVELDDGTPFDQRADASVSSCDRCWSQTDRWLTVVVAGDHRVRLWP